MPLPGGAQLINSHEDLLTAFTNIDQRLHRLIGGNEAPYIYRNKLYLPASMYSIQLGAIGSSGERVPPQGSLGQQAVVENSAVTQLAYTDTIRRTVPGDTFNNLGSASASVRSNAYKQIAVKPITLDGAGEAADQVLTTAIATYTDCIELIGVCTNSSDANTVFAFQDEDDAALFPFNFTLNLVASTFNDQFGGVFMASSAANKDIEVDITAGAALQEMAIFYRQWKEII